MKNTAGCQASEEVIKKSEKFYIP